MKTRALSFLGLGYVGLTMAACFASRGFKSLICDVDKRKVEIVNGGDIPFFEPGLRELVRSSVNKGFLEATTDPSRTVLSTDVTFIAVGTPSREDGSIDLTQVSTASEMIGESLSRKRSWHLVVVKSTVLPSTTDQLVRPTIERASRKSCGGGFGLCVNPEFLREGSAVEDMLRPDRLVVGEVDKRSGDVLEGFYRALYGQGMPPLIRTTPANAELIKYANNAFLAMKVSFINMFAGLCEKLPGTDVGIVAKGIGLDERIGALFLKAGAGWGGSCWPKDLAAIEASAERLGVSMPLIEATVEVNEKQFLNVVRIAHDLVGSLKGKRVAVLGLAFKPGTDDVRGAPSIKIINELSKRGAKVTVYDPEALENAKVILGSKVAYASSVRHCLAHADVAIIATELDELKLLKPEDFVGSMKNANLVDGRKIYDLGRFGKKLRFRSIGVGRTLHAGTIRWSTNTPRHERSKMRYSRALTPDSAAR